MALWSLICLVWILFFDPSQQDPLEFCDEGNSNGLMEGNIGETGEFPWLGVLRVHLHEGDSLKLALTGLVLIRTKYAIANADDIVRIPRAVFKDDSKAMFVPASGVPWFSRLEDYVTHPEYQIATLNTIAVLELLLDNDDNVPFRPACLPKYSFNASSHLYAIGYTDENKLLEKEIFKLQYLKQKNCKEFYTRSGLSEPNTQPAHYQCGYAKNSNNECVWENGVVMASNASGSWNLIGFGIRGPGCAAPARFIDISTYKGWVLAVTDLEQISDYRRSAFGTGFRKQNRKSQKTNKAEVKDVSVHETFIPRLRAQDSPYNKTIPKSYITEPYRITTTQKEDFVVDRVDQDAININIFDDMYENKPRACDDFKTLVYRDNSRIVVNGSRAQAAYRLSLYDMKVMGYTCIKVKVVSQSRSKATLWWKTYIDQEEGIPDMERTPENLLKKFPIPQRELPEEPSSIWKPGKHLKPSFVRDKTDYSSMKNVNLLIQFSFIGEAVLNVFIYGPSMQSSENTRTSNLRTNEVTSQEYGITTSNNLEAVSGTLKNQNGHIKIHSSVADSKAAPEYGVRDDNVFEKAIETKRNFKLWSDTPHNLSTKSKSSRLQKAFLRKVERSKTDRYIRL